MGITHLGLQRLIPTITEEAAPFPTDNLELVILPANDWFQQSDGTVPATIDNDVIGFQTDTSGNGNNLIQATTAAKPIVINNVVNGLRIARFDLTDDELANSTVAELLTIFIVAANASAGFPSGNHALFTQNGSNLQLIQTSGGGGLVRLVSGANAINDPTAWGTSFKIATIIASPSTMKLYFDGVLAGTAASANSHAGTITVGNFPASSQGWGGDVAGAMAYSAVLSNDDLNSVGQYLADLFGLSWSVIS